MSANYRDNPSYGGVDRDSGGLDGYDNPIEPGAVLQPPPPDQSWKAYDDVKDATAFQSLHSPEELARYQDSPAEDARGYTPSYASIRAWQRAGPSGGRAGNQSIPFGDPG